MEEREWLRRVWGIQSGLRPNDRLAWNSLAWTWLAGLFLAQPRIGRAQSHRRGLAAVVAAGERRLGCAPDTHRRRVQRIANAKCARAESVLGDRGRNSFRCGGDACQKTLSAELATRHRVAQTAAHSFRLARRCQMDAWRDRRARSVSVRAGDRGADHQLGLAHLPFAARDALGATTKRGAFPNRQQ